MWLNVHVHPHAWRYTVLFNGQKLENCFAANEEQCWADVYILDSRGKKSYFHLSKGIPYTRLYGYVQLIPPFVMGPPKIKINGSNLSCCLEKKHDE